MKKSLLLLGGALVLFSNSAFGWGKMGHDAIAYIAECNLTPKAKKTIEKILGHSIVYYATWMDEWRAEPGYEHTSAWHTASVDKNLVYAPRPKGDVIFALEDAIAKLQDYKQQDDSTVVMSLRCIIHFVGDMHCPSHTKYVDQPQYKNYNLRVKGKKTRSHSFWDSSPSFFHKGWTCEDFARELDTMSETEIAAICEGTPDDWAHENALAMREIFKLLPAACEYTDLPESDKERMREISDRQIVKAGYRLAAILNGIFDPKNSKR